MAIDSGLLVVCADLQAVGGIRQILLTDLTNIDTLVAGTDHDYSSIVVSGSPNWARFEFKNETASLTITGAKENGSTSYECAVSFYLPNIQGTAFKQLTQLETNCAVALVELTSGKKMVVGISEKYGSQGVDTNTWDRNQTYANLTSIEGGSGAAYADENGVTVTLTARQFELPREYTGTITPQAGDITAVTT